MNTSFSSRHKSSSSSRRDGLYLVIIGAVVFILLGSVLQRLSDTPQGDFETLYLSSHCLVDHCDPYSNHDVVADSGVTGKDAFTRMPYPPSIFIVTGLLAFLPWSVASVLWSIITMGSLIAASFIVWSGGKNHSPLLAGALIAFLLANSEVIAVMTNAAGLAVSLCVFGCWSFITEKHIKAGIFCFAVSLLIKPQDAGMLWLFFLVVGGVYRRYALRTLMLVALMGVPVAVAMWKFYPHWLQEWRTNLAFFAVKGGMTDPGPTSVGSHGLGAFINLQAALSEAWDNSHFYNPVTYLLMTALFVIFGWLVLNSKPNLRALWVGLAAMAPLSLLPVYHHVYDAKLLLLTIPACGILWTEGKRFIPVLTMLSIVFTSDIPLTLFRATLRHIHAITLEPVVPPVLLLMLGVSYLTLLRKSSERTSSSLGALLT